MVDEVLLIEEIKSFSIPIRSASITSNYHFILFKLYHSFQLLNESIPTNYKSYRHFNSEAIIEYLKMIRLYQHKMSKNESKYTSVWDNASIHKSSKIMKFLENSKMRMITIPAYSSWFNPVEHMIGVF